MPITPFHLGPGALLGVAVDGSFTAFLVANVVIDVESGYHLLTGAYPVHTFLHTFVGATIVAIATIAVLGAVERWRRVHRAHNPDGTLRSETSYAAIAAGGAAGSWSHVVLDGVMHGDMRPFAPWSDANPFYRVISVLALHGVCVAFALVALYVFIRLWGRVKC
jgi:hypothetical protein